MNMSLHCTTKKNHHFRGSMKKNFPCILSGPHISSSRRLFPPVIRKLDFQARQNYLTKTIFTVLNMNFKMPELLQSLSLSRLDGLI